MIRSTLVCATADTDVRPSAMPAGWNDRVSSVEDHHGCDVNLFWDNGFGGRSNGYVNHGDDQNGGGRHLSLTWSNDASSSQMS